MYASYTNKYLEVDLTRQEFGIPVVKVFIPGSRMRRGFF